MVGLTYDLSQSTEDERAQLEYCWKDKELRKPGGFWRLVVALDKARKKSEAAATGSFSTSFIDGRGLSSVTILEHLKSRGFANIFAEPPFELPVCEPVSDTAADAAQSEMPSSIPVAKTSDVTHDQGPSSPTSQETADTMPTKASSTPTSSDAIDMARPVKFSMGKRSSAAAELSSNSRSKLPKLDLDEAPEDGATVPLSPKMARAPGELSAQEDKGTEPKTSGSDNTAASKNQNGFGTADLQSSPKHEAKSIQPRIFIPQGVSPNVDLICLGTRVPADRRSSMVISGPIREGLHKRPHSLYLNLNVNATAVSNVLLLSRGAKVPVDRSRPRTLQQILVIDAAERLKAFELAGKLIDRFKRTFRDYNLTIEVIVEALKIVSSEAEKSPLRRYLAQLWHHIMVKNGHHVDECFEAFEEFDNTNAELQSFAEDVYIEADKLVPGEVHPCADMAWQGNVTGAGEKWWKAFTGTARKRVTGITQSHK